MHDLLETQKLYGKLHHAMMVLPAGQAYLTSLETMLATCSNHPFLPRSPPRDTPDNLEWWKSQLVMKQPPFSFLFFTLLYFVDSVLVM